MMYVVRFAAFGFAVVHGSLRRGGGEGGWPAGWLSPPPQIGKLVRMGSMGRMDARMGGWADGRMDVRMG